MQKTQDTRGLIPGWGRSPGGGYGNPLQYSCLENPMNRGAWWATVHGVAKSQTRLKWHTQGPHILQGIMQQSSFCVWLISLSLLIRLIPVVSEPHSVFSWKYLMCASHHVYLCICWWTHVIPRCAAINICGQISILSMLSTLLGVHLWVKWIHFVLMLYLTSWRTLMQWSPCCVIHGKLCSLTRVKNVSCCCCLLSSPKQVFWYFIQAHYWRWAESLGKSFCQNSVHFALGFEKWKCKLISCIWLFANPWT